jgi:hypothetical protein
MYIWRKEKSNLKPVESLKVRCAFNGGPVSHILHQQNVQCSRSVGANTRRLPEAPGHSRTLPEHGKVLQESPGEMVKFRTLPELSANLPETSGAWEGTTGASGRYWCSLGPSWSSYQTSRRLPEYGKVIWESPGEMGIVSNPPGALPNPSGDSGRNGSNFEPSWILHQCSRSLQNHVPAGALRLAG